MLQEEEFRGALIVVVENVGHGKGEAEPTLVAPRPERPLGWTMPSPFPPLPGYGKDVLQEEGALIEVGKSEEVAR